MANEALVVPDVLHSFTGREIDLVHINGIGIGVRGSASRRNIAVSPSLEFPELYHIAIELPCLVKLLLPPPTSIFLSFWEGSSGHHDSELLGYSSLKGVHKDAVVIYSAACLG